MPIQLNALQVGNNVVINNSINRRSSLQDYNVIRNAGAHPLTFTFNVRAGEKVNLYQNKTFNGLHFIFDEVITPVYNNPFSWSGGGVKVNVQRKNGRDFYTINIDNTVDKKSWFAINVGGQWQDSQWVYGSKLVYSENKNSKLPPPPFVAPIKRGPQWRNPPAKINTIYDIARSLYTASNELYKRNRGEKDSTMKQIRIDLMGKTDRAGINLNYILDKYDSGNALPDVEMKLQLLKALKLLEDGIEEMEKTYIVKYPGSKIYNEDLPIIIKQLKDLIERIR